MDEEPLGRDAHDTARGRTARAEGIALVVAGYDDSEEAVEAVRWAASLARRTGSALRVVWAWKIRDVWDTAVAADDQPSGPHLAELEGVARLHLTGVLTGLLGLDVAHVDVHLRQGPDSAGILLHAAADADLLVVGSRGRGRAASAVLGSVSARCVRDSPVPVLVIPHRMVRSAAAPSRSPWAGDTCRDRPAGRSASTRTPRTYRSRGCSLVRVGHTGLGAVLAQEPTTQVVDVAGTVAEGCGELVEHLGQLAEVLDRDVLEGRVDVLPEEPPHDRGGAATAGGQVDERAASIGRVGRRTARPRVCIRSTNAVPAGALIPSRAASSDTGTAPCRPRSASVRTSPTPSPSTSAKALR